ncbi:hypothetical protein V6C53_08290 [Desulfocurvibacter africanus]|uniref:hypothetical protein n=1 Tax=Desulfocurvibacter africanus TaxID=873 RepID=UPI002FDB0BD4
MPTNEITKKLLEDAATRNGGAFGMAYDLTKTYAGSANADGSIIPVLFMELYELFKDGKDPRSQD